MKQDLEGEVVVKDGLEITIELINNDDTKAEQTTAMVVNPFQEVIDSDRSWKEDFAIRH